MICIRKLSRTGFAIDSNDLQAIFRAPKKRVVSFMIWFLSLCIIICFVSFTMRSVEELCRLDSVFLVHFSNVFLTVRHSIDLFQ